MNSDGPSCKSPLLISLAEAKARSGLDLVSADEIASGVGASYHEMEGQAESKSHRSAREHCIMYLSAIGYDIFPAGVGVKGTYALADFVAIRSSRTVFVEVLSDANVVEDTIAKKLQLQTHGELCFVLFSGTKRSDETVLLNEKRALHARADVLYCRLDGYGAESGIEWPFAATVAYDTTRQDGIRVGLSFARTGRNVTVAVKLLTHLYRTTLERQTYFPISAQDHYEQIFLRVFNKLGHQLKCDIPRGSWLDTASSGNNTPAFRAMRKAAGLRMNDGKGRAVARIKSEYRGRPSASADRSFGNPFCNDLSLDDLRGVFSFERSPQHGVSELIAAIEEFGLSPEFNREELKQVLK
jgi:hypothetical protein